MRQDGGSKPAEPASVEPGLTAPADSLELIIDNRLFVLVLQHPQERSESRATAAALVTALRRARLVAGLSWPNLTRALGRAADPRRWGVLYLGSARPLPPSKPHEPAHPSERPDAGEIIALGRDGNPVPVKDRVLRALEGIVLLDGTWSQAKTLWWRNPWLLKLQRIVLNPPGPARLGRLRREPRQEALSTLEAASLVLRHTEPGPEAADTLLAALDRLIAACGGPSARVSAGDSDRSPGPFSDRSSGRRRRYRGISAAE
jgi:tRNA-uridine aminocarboxypropyltransferase